MTSKHARARRVANRPTRPSSTRSHSSASSAGTDHNPHGILGAHPAANGQTVIRTLRPEASAVAVVLRDGTRVEMHRLHEAGVFAAAVDGPPDDYRLAVSYGEQHATPSTTPTGGCRPSARSTCT